MDDISSVTADMLVTGNVGCMIQLRAGAQKRHMDLPVKHVVELLDEAFEESGERVIGSSTASRDRSGHRKSQR